MIYTKMTKKALNLCYTAHRDQKDKSGLPYVFHPFHVAEQMKDETTTVVALLHDVVEDSEYILRDLIDMGFSETIVEALKLLTHSPQDSYMEYVKKLSVNPIARKVKLADLAHNSDLSRLEEVTEKDLLRAEKYRNAIDFLKNIDDREN